MQIITEGVDLEDGLNAEDKAAKAEALWVGPPWFPLDFTCLSSMESIS